VVGAAAGPGGARQNREVRIRDLSQVAVHLNERLVQFEHVRAGKRKIVRIQVSPYTLAARGIGIDEVQSAIQSHNVNIPTGTLYGPDHMMTVLSSGQLTTADEYKNIIVVYRKDAPVRLQELATVLDSVEDDKTAAWLSTSEFTERFLNVLAYKQPGTNAIDVSNGVRALLPQVLAELPPTVTVDVIADRAHSVRESFQDVQFTMYLRAGFPPFTRRTISTESSSRSNGPSRRALNKCPLSTFARKTAIWYRSIPLPASRRLPAPPASVITDGFRP
jgi:multidrug efflux pump subunit AcrB